MTEVLLKQNGSRYTVKCSGHATGSPKVCAAVTALVTSLAGWLHNADGVEIVTERLGDGFAELEYICSGEKSANDLVMVGFLQLAASFGEYIAVTVAQDSPWD